MDRTADTAIIRCHDHSTSLELHHDSRLVSTENLWWNSTPGRSVIDLADEHLTCRRLHRTGPWTLAPGGKSWVATVEPVTQGVVILRKGVDSTVLYTGHLAGLRSTFVFPTAGACQAAAQLLEGRGFRIPADWEEYWGGWRAQAVHVEALPAPAMDLVTA